MANIMQPITPNRTKTAPKKASALSGNMTPSYVVFDECFVALERVCSWQHIGSQNRQRSGDHAWLDVCSLSIRPSHGGGGRGFSPSPLSLFRFHLSPFPPETPDTQAKMSEIWRPENYEEHNLKHLRPNWKRNTETVSFPQNTWIYCKNNFLVSTFYHRRYICA